jgi:hypothetical protein
MKNHKNMKISKKIQKKGKFLKKHEKNTKK